VKQPASEAKEKNLAESRQPRRLEHAPGLHRAGLKASGLKATNTRRRLPQPQKKRA